MVENKTFRIELEHNIVGMTKTDLLEYISYINNTTTVAVYANNTDRVLIKHIYKSVSMKDSKPVLLNVTLKAHRMYLDALKEEDRQHRILGADMKKDLLSTLELYTTINGHDVQLVIEQVNKTSDVMIERLSEMTNNLNSFIKDGKCEVKAVTMETFEESIKDKFTSHITLKAHVDFIDGISKGIYGTVNVTLINGHTVEVYPLGGDLVPYLEIGEYIETVKQTVHEAEFIEEVVNDITGRFKSYDTMSHEIDASLQVDIVNALKVHFEELNIKVEIITFENVQQTPFNKGLTNVRVKRLK